MAIRSERLKKYESELEDLERWFKLGLVPKKSEGKHLNEMETLKNKVANEKDRLKFLKESGEVEEYITPKRSASRPAFSDTTSLSDLDVGNHSSSDFDAGSTAEETDSDSDDDKGEEGHVVEEDTDTDDDPFNDRGRFHRGWDRDIMDPESNEW